MVVRSQDEIRRVTSELNDEILREMLDIESEQEFRPLPHAGADKPTWRVRFDIAHDESAGLRLDINGEITLGRGETTGSFVGLLTQDDAENLGVSRRHVLVRPTDTRLFVIDLESTNGTWLNGRSIGVNMPYSLSNGDHLRLGRLEMVVNILGRPGTNTAMLASRADLADILPEIGRAITAQLNRHEVLGKALELIIAHTESSEATVWLVDEQNGELYLEAGLGTNNAPVKRLPVKDTLAGKVIETGKPVRANRDSGGDQIKVKTGYLVEAVVYVPLTLGGVTFGVLSAAHRESGKIFSHREEKLMTAIADFTAVAVQNARVYQSMKKALEQRSRMLTLLQYALTYDMKSMMNAAAGYAGLLQSFAALDQDSADMVEQIVRSGGSMSNLIDRLIDILAVVQDPYGQHGYCDLVDVAQNAVMDMQNAAAAQGVRLHFQLIGEEPYIINGDARHLYRSVLNLIHNSLKVTPAGGHVQVSLIFQGEDIFIRVCDTGPGITPEDLECLFERLYWGVGQTGIGLGLPLVQATAEAHRGTVEARNLEDGGAELMIRLPAGLRVQ
jgi:signal transduction histidine kinase